MPISHNQNPETPDHSTYLSPDGLVEVVIKTNTAKRWPQHTYPVVCLLLKAEATTRVQVASDGRYDVMLTSREIHALFHALRKCDPKFGQTINGPAVDKCPFRKKRWDAINRRRFNQG